MKLAPVLVVATLVLTGCSALQVGPRDTGGKPRVVASFYPLAYVAQRIGGPHVQVQDLTTPGMDPHDYELTVQQTFDVADADVMFYDRGVQATVDDAVDETSPRRVVDAARVAPPVGDNVHVWVDPLRLDAIATEFTHAMAAADPAHARSYRTRDRSLHRDLTSLDRAFAAGLAHCRIPTAVVSHDAFGYWGRYGLSFEAVNGLSPDAEPSPEHLRALQDLIRKDGITTVYSEPLASPALADSLAHDLGIHAAVLDPVEGLSAATAGESYLSIMRANLRSLETGQGCQ